METLLQDVRFGFRRLLKSPGFALVAILSLALGIGANTAIFSLVNMVLFRPLPVANPEQIVTVSASGKDGSFTAHSYLNYVDLRDRSDVDGLKLGTRANGGPTRRSGVLLGWV